MSGAETGGRHRSSPSAAASRSTRATCATASRPTIPTPRSTGSTAGAAGHHRDRPGRLRRPGVDGRGPASGRMVDTQAAARSGRAPGRRRARARRRLQPGAGAGGGCDQRVDRADGASNRNGRHRRSTVGARCTCMPPTRAWGRPASGRSSTTRTGRPGPTNTARATWRCAAPAKDLLLAIVRRRRGGRRRHRGFRRYRGLGRMARTHAVLSGVFSRP